MKILDMYQKKLEEKLKKLAEGKDNKYYENQLLGYYGTESNNRTSTITNNYDNCNYKLHSAKREKDKK